MPSCCTLMASSRDRAAALLSSACSGASYNTQSIINQRRRRQYNFKHWEHNIAIFNHDANCGCERNSDESWRGLLGQ